MWETKNLNLEKIFKPKNCKCKHQIDTRGSKNIYKRVEHSFFYNPTLN